MIKRTFNLMLALVLMFALAGAALAETHTEFVTGNPVMDVQPGQVYVISNTLNFGDLDTPGPYATGILGGVSRFGETVQLLDVPANTYVRDVGINIYSAWGTTNAAAVGGSGTGLTMHGVQIGDGADTDGWIRTVDFGPSASGVSSGSISGTTLDAIGGAAGVITVATYTNMAAYHRVGGKMYTTADTIDALLPVYSHRAATVSGLTDFVLQVWAECVAVSSQQAYGTLR